MGIRDALAAEGNAPLVFMGGTCAGPKWRERLCGQVSQSFRWFNPVVEEWSEEAKEAELAVRAEADVMLYAITPYQEGCYSYLEMTEDAIRSEKPVVIAFLPSFEDKAFSEQQWSSIVSAKRLLERNNATVLLSMEELIDWFNRYNATSPDSKMLDTTELLRKAATAEENPVENKATPVTAAGLVNAVQEERAAEFAKPATAEPGTTPATGDAGTAEVKSDGAPSTESMTVSPDVDLNVSTEGFFDSVVGFVKGYNRNSPGDIDKDKGFFDARWVSETQADIKKTFGNEGWVKHNYHALEGSIGRDLVCRLSLDGKVLKPAEGIKAAVARIQRLYDKLAPACTAYAKALKNLESDAQKRIEAGEDGETVAKDTLAKVKRLAKPIQNAWTSDELMGGYVMRFNERASSVGTMCVAVKYKQDLTLPDLSVDDVIAAGKLLGDFESVTGSLFKQLPHMGSGCDHGVWENEAFDYDSTFGEDLYEYFYFQSIPGKYNDFMYEPLYLIYCYLRDVGRWLQAYTR